jgi:ABC-type Fe3+/spermidine/putrescine transport system ATPase subunit
MINTDATAPKPAPAAPQTAGQGDTPLVRLRGLARSFGAVQAVRPLDLDIHRGDFFALLGPSGCGKTTLLRMIGGFIAPTAGTVEIDGVDVTALGPERRPTNMVFQSYGLFPHMTVRQNIAYGLRMARRPVDEIAERVAEAIALVRLEAEANRNPRELSGGQAQRVALARALVMRPKVLLLDEPLGALDLKLRQAMQEELRHIHDEIGGTFVFVTHDQGEALALASRLAVMEAGRIEQEGTPEDIYTAPATRFVSTFIGEANLLAGRRDGGRVVLDGGPAFTEHGDDGPVVVAVRPETVRIAAGDLAADIALEGRLLDSVYLGAYVKYLVEVAGGETVTVHSADASLRRALSRGARVAVGWDRDAHRVIDDRG